MHDTILHLVRFQLSILAVSAFVSLLLVNPTGSLSGPRREQLYRLVGRNFQFKFAFACIHSPLTTTCTVGAQTGITHSVPRRLSLGDSKNLARS